MINVKKGKVSMQGDIIDLLNDYTNVVRAITNDGERDIKDILISIIEDVYSKKEHASDKTNKLLENYLDKRLETFKNLEDIFDKIEKLLREETEDENN